ncbi:MAG: hypothetical protein WCB02_12480 [Bradyrhizobium sp.]
MTGVVGTAMAVAIAFCTVTAAALCAAAALESVVAAVVVVEPSELLFVDLPSLGFVLDDLVLPCWAALALPFEFAPEPLSLACPPAGAPGLVWLLADCDCDCDWGGDWLWFGAWLLAGCALLDAAQLLAAGCGAAGSGAGGSRLPRSAGVLLSTSAAKLLALLWAGSGKTGLGDGALE